MTTSQRAGPTPQRRSQRDRRAEAEQRLVEAAAELVSAEGPGAITLAKVGARAGYSGALVAHHFGSKAGLMERLADTVTQEFRAAMAAGLRPGASLLDELVLLVDVYLDIAAEPPPVNRARLVLTADAVAHHDADARTVFLRADRVFRAALAERFARAVAAGELTAGTDADGLATVVVGMLRGVTFESMLDPTVDLRAARAEIVALVTGRLLTPDEPLRSPARRPPRADAMGHDRSRGDRPPARSPT